MKVKWSQEGNGLDLLGAGASEGRYQDGEYGACSIQREKVEEVEEVEEVAKVEEERPSGAYNFRELSEGIITFCFDSGEISAMFTCSNHAQLEEEEGQSFTGHGSEEEIRRLYIARGY